MGLHKNEQTLQDVIRLFQLVHVSHISIPSLTVSLQKGDKWNTVILPCIYYLSDLPHYPRKGGTDKLMKESVPSLPEAVYKVPALYWAAGAQLYCVMALINLLASVHFILSNRPCALHP